MRDYRGIIRKFIRTVVAAATMVFIFSATVYAENEYEITIPASITLSQEGTGDLTVGAEQSAGGRITMDLGSSLNNFHLKNQDDELSYSIVHKTSQIPVDTGDKKNIFVLESEESADTQETLAISLNELATMYGGEYKDTLTFVVERKKINPMAVEATQSFIASGSPTEDETKTVTGQTGAVGDVTYAMASQTKKDGRAVSYFTFDASARNLTKKKNTPEGEYVVTINVHADGDSAYLPADKVITVNVTVDSMAIMAAGSAWFRTSVSKGSIGKITLLKEDPEYEEGEYIDKFNADVNNKGKIVGYVIDPKDETGKYDLILARQGYVQADIYAHANSSSMFNGFSSCTSIDLSNFDTSACTDMGTMFQNCSALTSLDVSSFNTSACKKMSYMFTGCRALTSLNVSSFDTSACTTMEGMFYNCIALTSLNLSNFDTSACTTMYRMFESCSTLTSLDVSSFNTSACTTMYRMFMGCSALTSLDVSSFNTSACKNMSYMFSGCRALTSLNLSNFDTSACKDMSYMFESCSALTSLDVSSFNTSACTDMGSMFANCSALTSLNVSNFNTSACKKMSYMFSGCRALTSLNVSSFDTSACTTMGSMFYYCSALTSLNLSNFDTSACTNMSSMFYNCSALTSLNLSNFNTSACTSMSSMFNGCSGLTSLNLSNFNTSACKNMSYMFKYCGSLTSLNVSSFDTGACTNMREMFNGCTSLATIYASDTFTTDLVTNSADMFFGCSALTGGAGTTISGNPTDKTYARIDTTEVPGYFTGSVLTLNLYWNDGTDKLAATVSMPARTEDEPEDEEVTAE